MTIAKIVSPAAFYLLHGDRALHRYNTLAPVTNSLVEETLDSVDELAFSAASGRAFASGANISRLRGQLPRGKKSIDLAM